MSQSQKKKKRKKLGKDHPDTSRLPPKGLRTTFKLFIFYIPISRS